MRLEQRGLVRGRWGMTDNSRRARFYELTPRGRRQLANEREAWDRMVAIMSVNWFKPAQVVQTNPVVHFQIQKDGSYKVVN